MEKKVMYINVRDTIKDGDIVFFKPATFLGKLIPFFTGGIVSHCGFAVWVTKSSGGKRLMIIEGFAGGCRVVNMSVYAKRFVCALETSINWSEVEDYAYDKAGEVQYGYLDFIWIWLRELFVKLDWITLSKKIPDAPGEVCSQLVADVLIRANTYVDLQTSLISPHALLEYLRCKSVAEKS
jgi:hypothetical protein